ncbi:NAD(P)H-dependent glycerol-3-phosphate dehydrogenase [Sphingomonas astaxanthinifaciens]|uniref:Glycerol-3-phosphate dehydrogenase [NAD(P)+] n=1 Tax=Sphingomonas astaxanthinifaciens DSM 22298 TaxID=1123267 RepID=A0ABQ5Z1T4_9SPHN|nr:NAD(P)H-dependent glycerol-3-phosphate dehydrogenase [Sphingomonas astaxanthinifaciens]GLR46723.1 glycerol-3-phosphate dehydrogenase [NAD(P)+] [Sphingomonas astaxanthinifaciens DSM 22298]
MKVGVVGGGAWGTALAQVAAQGGETLLWSREPEVAESIAATHENRLFLPGVPLSERIRPTTDLADLAQCDLWLLVTPAQHMRAVLEAAPPCAAALVLCSKGIEERSGLLLHAVARQACAEAEVMVLSGPTFAHEVAAGLPTALTLAADDEEDAEPVRARLARPEFRIYLSDDVAGAEVGGAVKNVLAIACGVVEGRGLGQNARAALIARGFAEMTRFGLARGARPETLAGLSGLGDLVLTCSSTSSRNYSLGKGLGQGRPAAELMADRRTVAEGAFTAPVLRRLAEEEGIDMPIVAAVDDMLAGRARVDEVLERLLSRPHRPERA